MADSKRAALLPFVVISITYLLFTVTDGAIRMIVLQHGYNKSFSAMQVAVMFTLYELAGVVTNLAAGVAGAKWGIRATLLCGLLLQLLAYGLLFGWDDSWDQATAIAYVTVAQLFAGVAKDLTKLGGKTVTKLVTPAEKSTQLFKLVAMLTGWKNSLKGVGYFLGSALVSVSYELALGTMMALIALALPIAAFGLHGGLGTAKKKNASWSDVFATNNSNLNWLSLARLFLFASRDFWFEVPLPFFLRSPGCDGLGSLSCAVTSDCPAGALCTGNSWNVSSVMPTGVCGNPNSGGGCGGLGWDRVLVGSIMGAYIIVYGQCQSYTPQLVTGPLRQTPPNKLTEVLWGMVNTLLTALMAAVAWVLSSTQDEPTPTALATFLIPSLVAFAIIFAINSSIHSFLVVHYAKEDKVATSVGFYYMSNAAGRLLGTLGSGVIYTYLGGDRGPLAGTDARRGLAGCFVAGAVSSLLAALITLKINDEAAGLRCGRCVCVAPTAETATKLPTRASPEGTDEGRQPEGKDNGYGSAI